MQRGWNLACLGEKRRDDFCAIGDFSFAPMGLGVVMQSVQGLTPLAIDFRRVAAALRLDSHLRGNDTESRYRYFFSR